MHSTRFASAVLDGVMGPQKPFKGLRLRLGSCWEEWKRKVFPWRRVIWFALQTNQWFLTYIRPPNIWLLTTFLIKRELFHNFYEKIGKNAKRYWWSHTSLSTVYWLAPLLATTTSKKTCWTLYKSWNFVTILATKTAEGWVRKIGLRFNAPSETASKIFHR